MTFHKVLGLIEPQFCAGCIVDDSVDDTVACFALLSANVALMPQVVLKN
jgi:hypothetical protein